MNSLKVRNELREIDRVREFLRQNLGIFKLSEEEYFKVELALVEICTNVIRYAYPGTSGELTVCAWERDGKFFLEVRDRGVPFDPSNVKRPRLKEMISQNQKGGLGIFLARRMMDGFAYRRQDDENILTMFKRLAKPRPKTQ